MSADVAEHRPHAVSVVQTRALRHRRCCTFVLHILGRVGTLCPDRDETPGLSWLSGAHSMAPASDSASSGRSCLGSAARPDVVFGSTSVAVVAGLSTAASGTPALDMAPRRRTLSCGRGDRARRFLYIDLPSHSPESSIRSTEYCSGLLRSRSKGSSCRNQVRGMPSPCESRPRWGSTRRRS